MNVFQHGDRIALGLILLALIPLANAGQDSHCVVDDMERLVCLDEPAERVIALSPGITELLFAAGAGDQVIGTTDYSDYPDAARDVPRIGSYKRIDLEAVLAAEPDLVIAWISGNPTEQVLRLEELGLPVYWGEQRDFEDVSGTIRRYGALTGQEATAQSVADDFDSELANYRQDYRDADSVEVFYQVWDDPLMTVNGEHLISRAIGICGGETQFSDLPRLTPRLDVESVLAADPEAIIAGGMGENDPSWLEFWEQFDQMQAVRSGHLFFVPPSTLQRPTPRILDGIALVCEQLDTVREQR